MGGTWLVTGGGTGLGRAIAVMASRQGARVAVNYSRSREAAESTAAEIGGVAIQGDVATDAARVVEEAAATLGGLDVLVNNAGTTVHVPFRDLDGISESDWDRIMAVNVRAAFVACRAAAKHGVRAILNVASVAGLHPRGSSLPYSVSKAALIHLTMGLAVALAPHTRVNAIAPGYLDTGWWRGRGDPERAGRATLLGHVPTLADTATAAVSLILNESVTGQILTVDAGANLHW
ncbi:MAG TPA: SDR family NAD(P)-dependent oxidoreductase [Bacillota bacterium]|nr:SDR family NAD(P)-dependent oxidoreductase [Bacillota bacterium]